MSKATILMLILAAFLFGMVVERATSLPDCHEDSTLVGVDDYDGKRWSRYICGPALDDLP